MDRKEDQEQTKAEKKKKNKNNKWVEMGVEWPKGVSGRPRPLILSPLNPT